MSRHTKTPWECVKGRATIGGHGHTVWMLGTAYETEPGTGIGTAIVILPDEDDTPGARAEREATAAFICKAVNAHGALVEAAEHAAKSEHHPHCASRGTSYNCTCHVEKARAALALAKGE